jgi:uncharacterized protein YjbI with pentapeptide repeats
MLPSRVDANLFYANLFRANLGLAILRGADLLEFSLIGDDADMLGAKLTGVSGFIV